MTTTKCDRCGKEIDCRSLAWDIAIRPKNEDSLALFEAELCETCAADAAEVLGDWLKQPAESD